VGAFLIIEALREPQRTHIGGGAAGAAMRAHRRRRRKSHAARTSGKALKESQYAHIGEGTEGATLRAYNALCNTLAGGNSGSIPYHRGTEEAATRSHWRGHRRSRNARISEEA